MRGPPGNGKTISLKAIMKTVQQKGYNPLYVKSFQSEHIYSRSSQQASLLINPFPFRLYGRRRRDANGLR